MYVCVCMEVIGHNLGQKLWCAPNNFSPPPYVCIYVTTWLVTGANGLTHLEVAIILGIAHGRQDLAWFNTPYAILVY